MRVIERVGELYAVAEYVGRRQRPLQQPFLERLAFEILHHQETDRRWRSAGRGRIGRFPDVVQVADVRMIQRRDRLRLALEAGAAVGVRGERLAQDLDRHDPIEARVAGLVDVAHPAAAERRQDLVWTETRAGTQRHRLGGKIVQADDTALTGRRQGRSGGGYDAGLSVDR